MSVRIVEGPIDSAGESDALSRGRTDVGAVVTFSGKGRLGVKFDNLTLHQQAELASLTFARADAWVATWGTGQRDKPLRSLKSVIVIGLRGMGQLTATAFKSLKPR